VLMAQIDGAIGQGAATSMASPSWLDLSPVFHTMPIEKASMQLTTHVSLMADYNASMNANIYTAAATLSAHDLARDRGAFFGSIIATLNHIAVGDTFWLKRFLPLFQNHPELDPIRELAQPTRLDEIVFSDMARLRQHRLLLDTALSALAHSVMPSELALVVTYTNTQGVTSNKNLFSLFMHVFNHQTHHRGQVTTLLSQAGIDVGGTDLVTMIPNTPLA
jgi:uncharacterized damage-inducible protein DinB